MASIWENLVNEEPPIDSCVDFDTETRFHLALNVMSIDNTLPFYEKFFGRSPDLVRDGYAKFELSDPPFMISINEVPHNAKGGNRLGLQVSSESVVKRLHSSLQSDLEVSEIASANGKEVALSVVDPEKNVWKIFA